MDHNVMTGFFSMDSNRTPRPTSNDSRTPQELSEHDFREAQHGVKLLEKNPLGMTLWKRQKDQKATHFYFFLGGSGWDLRHRK